MKKRKYIILFVFLFFVILIAGIIFIKYLNNSQTQDNSVIEEYTPEEEISENQNRETIVTVYFISKENGKIMPEAKMVDVKEMMNNPYEMLINLTIEGPKNSNSEKIFPENVKLLNTELKNNILKINFSEEFLNIEEAKKENTIKCLVNTLTELKEIDGIEILINNEKNNMFSEVYQRDSN